MKHRTPKIAVLDIKYLMPKYKSLMRIREIKVNFSRLDKLKKDKVTEINVVACHSDCDSANRINRYVKEAFDDLPNQYNFDVKITFVALRGRHIARAMTADIVKHQADKLIESGVDTVIYNIPPTVHKYKRSVTPRKQTIINKVVSLGIMPNIK